MYWPTEVIVKINCSQKVPRPKTEQHTGKGFIFHLYVYIAAVYFKMTTAVVVYSIGSSNVGAILRSSCIPGVGPKLTHDFNAMFLNCAVGEYCLTKN